MAGLKVVANSQARGCVPGSGSEEADSSTTRAASVSTSTYVYLTWDVGTQLVVITALANDRGRTTAKPKSLSASAIPGVI